MTAYLITLAILALIAVLLGFALNLQWGTAGLPNFGLAGLFSLGAYAAALSALADTSWWYSVTLSAAVCAAACTVIALISVRLSEEYLAILTLGFSEVIGLIALSEDELTGGSLGLSGIPRPFSGLVPENLSEIVFLALVACVAVFIFLLLRLILRSPFGRALQAAREDEIAARTLGKNVLAFRVKAFAIGGAIIGVAGAFHAFYLTYVDPTQFSATITGYTFLAVILGGRGSNAGAAVGAALIVTIMETARFAKDAVWFLDATQLASLRLILAGLGLILLLIYRPQGLLSEYRLRRATLEP